jgi:hypothetical protein
VGKIPYVNWLATMAMGADDRQLMATSALQGPLVISQLHCAMLY